MHKILFTLFISIFLLLPKSEALAKSLDRCSSFQEKAAVPTVVPSVDQCPEDTICTLQQLGSFDCYASKPAPAAAPGAPGPKTATTAIKCELKPVCPKGQHLNVFSSACLPEGSWSPVGTPTPTILSASCPVGTCPNSISTDGSCECVASSTGSCAVTADTAICTGTACTTGGGSQCFIAPGSPDDGKPIPAGEFAADGVNTGIYTAIGCIPTRPQALVEGLLKYGTFAGGGVAFLLMLLAGLQMITAEGNPEIIKKSQEKFYSAIIGLLLIIFSVLLMQVIGVDLLGLKGFTR